MIVKLIKPQFNNQLQHPVVKYRYEKQIQAVHFGRPD